MKKNEKKAFFLFSLFLYDRVLYKELHTMQNFTSRRHLSNFRYKLQTAANHARQGVNISSHGYCYYTVNNKNCWRSKSTNRYVLVVYDDAEFIGRILIELMIMIRVCEQLTCYINPFTTWSEIMSHLHTYIPIDR